MSSLPTFRSFSRCNALTINDSLGVAELTELISRNFSVGDSIEVRAALALDLTMLAEGFAAES